MRRGNLLKLKVDYLGAVGRGPGGKRDRVLGWTGESAGRLREKLAGLDLGALAGLTCIAATRTVRSCPESAAVWAKLWNVHREGLRRRGLVHFVDVLEWQERRVPHGHALLWFERGASVTGFEIIGDWLRIAEAFGPLRVGQDAAIARQESAVAEYLAKHGFRTAKHGQRDNARAPARWLAQGSVGRLWSASRGLPVLPESRVRGLEVRCLEALRESIALRHGYLAFKRAVREGRDPEKARAEVQASIRGREVWQGLVLWERDDEWLARAWDAARHGEVVDVPCTGAFCDLTEEEQQQALRILNGEEAA